MSNDPYEVPPASHDGGASGPHSQAVLDKVGPPAIGLMIVGAVNLVLSLWNLVSASLILAGIRPSGVAAQREQMAENIDPNDPGAQSAAEIADSIFGILEILEGPVGLATNLASLAIAILIIFAGLKMKGLRSYGLALTGSILAMIPCLSCCLVGLPIGIWAMVVLMNAEVKQSFK